MCWTRRLDPESRKRSVFRMGPGCGGPQWKYDDSVKLGMSSEQSRAEQHEAGSVAGFWGWEVKAPA